MSENGIYCPICQRVIEPEQYDDGYEYDGLVYVHDDIDHEDSDIDALFNPIQ